jgi:hypothetical protein
MSNAQICKTQMRARGRGTGTGATCGISSTYARRLLGGRKSQKMDAICAHVVMLRKCYMYILYFNANLQKRLGCACPVNTCPCARSAPLAGGRVREARPRQPVCARSADALAALCLVAARRRSSDSRVSSRTTRNQARRHRNPENFPKCALRARLFAPTPSRLGKHMPPPLLLACSLQVLVLVFYSMGDGCMVGYKKIRDTRRTPRAHRSSSHRNMCVSKTRQQNNHAGCCARRRRRYI